MKPDHIVEEIRKVREEHAKSFDYDITKICADMRKKQERLKNRIVSGKPKILLKKTGS